MAARKPGKNTRAGKKSASGSSGKRSKAQAEDQARAELAEAIERGAPGRVVAHHGVAVLVRFEDGRERQVWLQTEQRAVVGDRVCVLHERLFVLPAYGVLRRRDPRGRERTIAVNLDVLGIVVAPEPREPPGYVDRGFVIARAAGIEPLVIMNKLDLPDGPELLARLREIYGPSARVLATSAVAASAAEDPDGSGLDAIRTILAGDAQAEEAGSVRLGALVGPSGVGKSSLLNALVPDLELVVGELNRGSGKGRHTTTTATLHTLEGGGMLVDTAGFKDFIAVDVAPLEAAAYFPGFEEAVASGCRFRDCLHTSEPDCAVLAALAEGRIGESRHRAYWALLSELLADSGPPGSRDATRAGPDWRKARR